MPIVVVESPAKAKTLRSFLGAGHEVIATRGHLQDLSARDGSVAPARDFAMRYVTRRGATRTLGAIASALRNADTLVLATDPDREGEAIAWQVLIWLRDKGTLQGKAVRRVVFHEVSAEAVREAMDCPREIDMALVRAQQARRALDYLVGFHLSALMCRKLRGIRSVGRVQSVALRLVCAREAEIEAFEPQAYWTLDAGATAEQGGTFTARLTELDGEALDRPALGSEAAAEEAAWRVRESVFHVAAVERSTVRRQPVAPFTTATLQQEASRQLGFGVRRTMQLAQTLYEGVTLDGETAGLVTYPRTDSVALSVRATSAIRKVIRERLPGEYLPRNARAFRRRARNAREAHEAIRPTDLARTPDSLAACLGADESALYALIWRRTVASQVAAARHERVRVTIASETGDVVLTASGSTTRFDGFFRLYCEGRDEDAGEVETQRPLPAMAEGERVLVTEVRLEQRHTRAPERYAEADLVRRLEALGIGRASTYASIVGVLREREFVLLSKRRFVPTERGRVLAAFLEACFARWVAYRFTAGLEADLDRVAAGGMVWKAVLRGFWGDFEGALDEAHGLDRATVHAAVERALEPYLFGARGALEKRACPSCADGRLGLELGRYGAFIGCSRFPACRYRRALARENVSPGVGGREPAHIGTDPRSGQPLTLRSGRDGLYVQRGEDLGEDRAARAWVPKGIDPHEVTPDMARALLSLPRTVGVHPVSGEPILTGIGRDGAWLEHGPTFVLLPDDDDVLTIGLNRAVLLVDTKTA